MINTIIFDQEGAPVSPREIQVENSRKVEQWLIERLSAFQGALQERCERNNEVFNDLGFDQQLNMHLFQIGLVVWGLGYDHLGVFGQPVGKIGQ